MEHIILAENITKYMCKMFNFLHHFLTRPLLKQLIKSVILKPVKIVFFGDKWVNFDQLEVYQFFIKLLQNLSRLMTKLYFIIGPNMHCNVIHIMMIPID